MSTKKRITHEVTIYISEPYVFKGTYDEVVKVRERYINLNVSVSGVRPITARN